MLIELYLPFPWIVIPILFCRDSFCSPNAAALAEPISLLNVSYDPTRELYQAFNQAFAKNTRPRPGKMSSCNSLTAAPENKRAR